MFLSLVEVKLYVNCILRELLPNGGSHTDGFSVPEHHEWALGAAHNPSCPRLEGAFLSLNTVQYTCDPQSIS